MRGAAGAGAAYALGGPVLAAAAKTRKEPCVPGPPGEVTGAIAVGAGRRVWSTDVRARTITAHRGRSLRRGRSIDVGGSPAGIAISPDGQTALVTTAFFDNPGLAVVDLGSGRVERLDVGPDPGAVAFAPDGRNAWVVGRGRRGTVTRVEPRSGRVHRPLRVGAHPRGIAIVEDGDRLLVALNGAGAVALVGTGPSPRVRRIKTPRFPFALAVAPDGRRALVTHNGYGDRIVTAIDLRKEHAERRVKVGADPGGVAFSPDGAEAIVATGAGRAVILGAGGHRRRANRLGGRLRSVAVAGRTAFVADGRSGRIHRVRLGGML